MKYRNFVYKILIILSLFMFIGVTNVQAAEPGMEWAMTCKDSNVIRSIGIISFSINVVKVVIPVLLIIVTIKDMVNAVLNQDDGEIKKQAGVFIKKFIIAVFIFFVPTIVNVIIGYVEPYDKSKTKYTECIACLTNYSDCK